ncbi:MAG: 8-oxoguanine DNA glycosylase [Clostridiales bacterium]|nr:8-oxoguanine DNA glycosylase [Clostridiales bacterium]
MELPIAFTYDATYFNVRDTLECGQIFRYKQINADTYAVFSCDKYAELTTVDGVVQVRTTDREYFWHFFDLDTDYEQKVNRISAISPLMKEAAGFGKGIRILNQDLTEMIFSFIISANNNIKRIQLIIDRLCNAIGCDTPFGKAFPTVQAMADASVEFYTGIGAGYRDKYLSETAKMLLDYDLNCLISLDSECARRELLKFMGIGPKVADCILLFGLRRGDVFPVDTWLKKVYHEYFEQGHRDIEISRFFCNLFGEDAGLCQQYLFYFQRKYRQNA